MLSSLSLIYVFMNHDADRKPILKLWKSYCVFFLALKWYVNWNSLRLANSRTFYCISFIAIIVTSMCIQGSHVIEYMFTEYKCKNWQLT